MAQAGSGPSMLLLENFFSAQDDRFLATLREVSDHRALAAFVERWKKDPRPWAREQILKYAALPLNCAGHQPVVKRLYKHAEHEKQTAILAAFMASFDRSVRRQRRTRYGWDSQTRTRTAEEYLYSRRDGVKGDKARKYNLWRRGSVLFSRHTRQYLRRRVWRYFRVLGKEQPGDYVNAACRALKQYVDADLVSGENIIDSWSLLHLCFKHSDAIEFTASTAVLREGKGLGDLKAAPAFAKLWAEASAAEKLMDLIVTAGARLVRVWSTQMLREKHAAWLKECPVEAIFKLLEHDDEEVQQFGATLLLESQSLARLPIADWLKLLKTQNLVALQTVCDAFQKNVSPERLDLTACVEVASSLPAPAAKLGFALLKSKTIATEADRAAIAKLAQARCGAVAGELGSWAIGILGTAANYNRDAISQFFDSTQPDMRAAAWAWMLQENSPGYNDAGLWARLIETPYDDLRLGIVEQLSRRSGLPGTATDALAPVWCSVLLSIHRGGRQKSQAVRQIGQALVEKPERATALVPVLAVAVRSIRGAEFRAGLAALTAAVEKQPELAKQIRLALPELQLGEASPPAAAAAAGGGA